MLIPRLAWLLAQPLAHPPCACTPIAEFVGDRYSLYWQDAAGDVVAPIDNPYPKRTQPMQPAFARLGFMPPGDRDA